jgi:hypothetical protein
MYYSNVNVTTDNFTTWFTRTNQLLDALNTKIVTTDSNTTIGNTAISGTFTSNTVYTKALTGGSFGNTQSLPIGSNTSITGTLSATGNTSIGGTLIVNGNITMANGEQVWHSNNDGVGSGLDADLVQGRQSNASLEANTVVLRNENNDIFSNTLHMASTQTSSNNDTIFYSSANNSILKNDSVGFRTSLDVYSKTETDSQISNTAAVTDAAAVAYAIALG